MFEWDDKFLLGDIFIDGEHQILFRLAAKLTDEKGALGHAELMQYLKVTFEYTVSHFQHEERIMRDVGWEGYERHAEIHRSIIAEMKDIIAQTRDVMKLQLKLSYLLNKWIVDHVVVEDHKFKAHLIKKRGYMEL
jgi:hemerythrin